MISEHRQQVKRIAGDSNDISEALRERVPFVTTLTESSNTSFNGEDWNICRLSEVQGEWPAQFTKANKYYAELLAPGQVDLSDTTLSAFAATLLEFKDRLHIDPVLITKNALLHRNTLIAGGNSRSRPLYLPRQRMPLALTKHAEAIRPSFWRSDFGPHLWIGTSPGSLHFDRVDGLLIQVSGEKTIVFSPPDDYRFLYMNPQSHLMPNHSETGFWHWVPEVVRETWPLAMKSSRYWTTLVPGDAVHIPAGWFHGVLADPLSVSITFTKDVKDERLQRPPLRHAVEARESRRVAFQEAGHEPVGNSAPRDHSTLRSIT